nr:AraC family transcriptional regulator [Caballeronia sordidicola]
MQAALPRLRETASSLAELANFVGYDSETAFSRAFKRIMGCARGSKTRCPKRQRRGRVPACGA